MRLAFSMPVHERIDAVLDSVRNILHFNPGALVVLHAAQQSRELDELERYRSDQILVNPTRYRTGTGSGLFLMHCANYRYLESLQAPFDTFCILSSNELFVRSGLESYAAEVGNAFQAVPLDSAEGWHVAAKCAADPKVAALLRACGGAQIYGGHTEGQFYTAALFGEMCRIYHSVFGEESISSFETEEIVPQTIAMARGAVPHPPFTLADFSNVTFRVNRRAIALLSDPARIGRVRLNLGVKAPTYLRNPHWNGTNETVYALKRIPRDPAHELRCAIRELEARPADTPGAVPKKPMTDLVPLYSWRRLIFAFILLARRLGVPIPLNVGFRSLYRRWRRP